MVCEKILEDASVLGDVISLEWNLYFHGLEKDVLSMELEDSFGELALKGDPTSIFLAAKALIGIERKHGLFPRILGKGDNAKRLTELLLRMRSEAAAAETTRNGASKRHAVGTMPSTTIENLIIIDRQVDMATPLMTQLTYEGLLDEVFDLRHGQTEVNATIVGQGNIQSAVQPDRPASQQQNQGLKRKIRLDGTDKLYDQLRDANFAVIGALLNKVARRLQTDYKGYEGGKQKTVAELKDLVNKLPGYQVESQSLKIHTGLAEEVMKQMRSDIFVRILEVQQNVIAGTEPTALLDILEDVIAQDSPLPSALRLLALCSVVAGGFRSKDFDNLRRQILHAYGHQHLLTLDNLEKMQLLTQRTGTGLGFSIPLPSTNAANPTTAQRTDYSSVRRSLNLILDDVDEADPSDIAYTYSGYAPLSVRLVQCILQKPYLASLNNSKSKATTTQAASTSLSNSTYTESSSGWLGHAETLRSVKGATVDETQTATDHSAKARQVLAGTSGRKTCIVFFLGGITFAEISALRFVAGQERERSGRELLICTTGIVSGGSVVRAAMEGVP